MVSYDSSRISDAFHEDMRGLCYGGGGPDRLQAKVYNLDA